MRIVAYTLLDARYDEAFTSGAPAVTVPAGNRIPGVPQMTLYAELQWRHLPSGFSTALEARRNGRVYVDDQNSDSAEAYTVANLRLGFEQKARGWRITETLRIDNLTNRNYIGSVIVADANGRFFEPAPRLSAAVIVTARLAFSLPYAGLTPERVLDALDSVGVRGDGRLLALNSYENRVYQVWRDEELPVVAKFYRPARWTDAQILEEHAFTAELAAREVPVVAAMELEGRTLHEFQGFRFAVFARRGGRPPELEDPSALEWIGRFLGRIHAVGAAAAFRERPALDIASFGDEPREYLLAHDFIPSELCDAWTSAVDMALGRVRSAFETAGGARKLRLHGDCHAGNVLWTPERPALRRPRRQPHRARRCRTCGCCSRASARRPKSSSPSCSRATRSSASSTGSNCC